MIVFPAQDVLQTQPRNLPAASNIRSSRSVGIPFSAFYGRISGGNNSSDLYLAKATPAAVSCQSFSAHDVCDDVMM